MAWKNVASTSLGSTHVLEILLEQRGQSVSNNSTEVAYEMRIRRVATNSGAFWSNGSSSASLTLNGSNISVANFKYDFRSSYTKILASGTRTIGHNNDGSKTVSVSGSVRMDPNGRLPNGSTSGSLSLTTIARKSTFTAPGSFTMGNAFTVNISRAASSFTHAVQVHYGNTIIHSSSGHSTSASVAVNHSQLYNLTPSVSSATLKITVITYNGSSNIGSNTRNITANNNLQPSFSGFSISDTDSTTQKNIGAYVQSRSRLKISINGASATTGASVRTYRIEVDRQTLNAQSGTTQPIKSSGNVTIKGTIIDSRGKSYSRSQTVNVLAYTPPTVTSVKFYRTDSKGVANDYGTYAKFEMGYRITTLNNKNSKGLKVQVGSNNTNKTPTTYSGTHTELFGSFDVSLPYNISFYVADLFGSSTSPQVLPTGAVTMMWGRDSVAIGTSELKGSGTLNVQNEIYQNNGRLIADLNTIPSLIWAPIDFNDYWKHGVWSIPQSADVSNSKNAPTTHAGRLEVYTLRDYLGDAPGTPWKYTWQMFTTLHGITYVRRRDSGEDGKGAWGGWRRILDTEEVGAYVISFHVGQNSGWKKWSDGSIEAWGIDNAGMATNRMLEKEIKLPAGFLTGTGMATKHNAWTSDTHIYSAISVSYIDKGMMTVRIFATGGGKWSDGSTQNFSWYARGRWK